MREAWKQPFLCYAVARGKVVGVFDSWYAFRDSIDGFHGESVYKGFHSRLDAEIWLAQERQRLEQWGLSG